MADTTELLDLSNSKLILQGTKQLQKDWSKRVADKIDELTGDKKERKDIYKKRKDFYQGNQGDYSNIVGIIKDTKQKAGHTNTIVNYAGKTTVKIAMGIANNPPKYNFVPKDINDEMEIIRTQAVEDFADSILDDNKFWRRTYRRSAFIQAEYGDAAIKTYIQDDKIKIIGHDDMTTIMVGWNGTPGEYDFTIVQEDLTPKLVYDLYGIKVNEKMLGQIIKDENKVGNNSMDNDAWGTKSTQKNGNTGLPTGKNKMPKVTITEYDSNDVYILKIENEIVELVLKDDVKYPKVKMWTIVANVPNPPSPWSIADIDYLMDIQVELNENDNRSADHLRVGNVQRYVAYNMDDFDPSSIKPTSGQVIFVTDPDGKSRFEPLPTNINNFPDDSYNTRKLNQLYDMGLPKVNYGASGADSGRSKAIDYQSSVDLTQFKRDAWELAMMEVFEKIQIYGNHLLGDQYDWFQDSEKRFVTRNVEFDWADALPTSQSEKIVNVANKFNMIGISLKQAYRELGYRNPEAMIAELTKELQDKNLMILRAKAWQLSQGLLEANNNAMALSQTNGSQIAPASGGNQPNPVLTSDQNTGGQPMAAKGGTTAVSSAGGVLEKAQQNLQAGGGL
jgi:hypothetical protein